MCAYLSNNTASCLQREGWVSTYLSKKKRVGKRHTDKYGLFFNDCQPFPVRKDKRAECDSAYFTGELNC